jgi:hypothetical protein
VTGTETAASPSAGHLEAVELSDMEIGRTFADEAADLAIRRERREMENQEGMWRRDCR